jgi:gas vesicle protein
MGGGEYLSDAIQVGGRRMTHEKQMDGERNGGGFFSGMLFGGLIGAAAALLLAPQSGATTRSLIRMRGQEFKDQVERTAKGTRDRVEQMVGEASSRAAGLKERGQQMFEGEKERVERTARAAAGAAREAWDQGESA